MTHPRDPRLRRQHTDPLAAAVRLELAADQMRRDFSVPAITLDEFDAAEPPATELLAADVVTAVQLGTVAAPLTALEFAAALAATDDHPCQVCGSWEAEHRHGPDPEDVAGSAVPAPPVPPAAPVPYPTDSLGRPIEDGVNGWIDPEPVQVFSSEQADDLVRDLAADLGVRGKPRLNWRSRHDPESLRYGIRPTLRGSTPVQDVLLPSDWPTLDQAAEGACTGAAVITAWNTVHPDQQPMTMADALRVFRLAEKLDQYPGEGLGGSSVLGAMKAAVQLGLFGGYLWSFGTRDIAQTILGKRRPVVAGVPWSSRMYETGPGGLVVLGGDDEGLGHCLAIVGIRRKGPQGQDGPFFVWHNSWGDDYGDDGLGYIHHRDLAQLLRGRGEAAIPTDDPQTPTS